MAEKNILAYFKTPEEAEGVKRRLDSLRAIDVSIDRISGHRGDQYTEHFTNSIAILANSDPTESGMSHGGQGGPTGHDILLTAVVDEVIHHQALRIVEEAGGKL